MTFLSLKHSEKRITAPLRSLNCRRAVSFVVLNSGACSNPPRSPPPPPTRSITMDGTGSDTKSADNSPKDPVEKTAKPDEPKYAEIPPLMFKFLAAWRVATFVWANLGVWGTWCGGDSLWGSNKTSDEKASAAFALMCWFVSIVQFFYVLWTLRFYDARTRAAEWKQVRSCWCFGMR